VHVLAFFMEKQGGGYVAGFLDGFTVGQSPVLFFAFYGNFLCRKSASFPPAPPPLLWEVGREGRLPPLRGLQKCGVASPRVVYLCACGAVERRRVGRWVAPGRDRVTWGKWRLLRAKKIPVPNDTRTCKRSYLNQVNIGGCFNFHTATYYLICVGCFYS